MKIKGMLLSFIGAFLLLTCNSYAPVDIHTYGIKVAWPTNPDSLVVFKNYPFSFATQEGTFASIHAYSSPAGFIDTTIANASLKNNSGVLYPVKAGSCRLYLEGITGDNRSFMDSCEVTVRNPFRISGQTQLGVSEHATLSLTPPVTVAEMAPQATVQWKVNGKAQDTTDVATPFDFPSSAIGSYVVSATIIDGPQKNSLQLDSCTIKVQSNPIPTYAVTFDKNGGATGPTPTTITVDSSTSVGTLPTPPTRAGYVFAGWNTAADGSGTEFTASTNVSANITVYAKWVSNPYTVTFDKNGGATEANPTSKPVISGGNVGTLPTPPTKAGNAFAGWNTAADGSGTAFTGSTSVTANITVYAQWAINSFSVTFDKNGGTTDANPSTKTAPYNGNIGSLPTPPTRTGYTFAGWNTAVDGSGTAFTASNSVAASITVYAQWTIDTFTVTFDKNGGTADANPSTKIVASGGNVGTLPTPPTKTGNAFAGWNTAADGSGTAFTASTSVTANITVYAQWATNSFSVTFDKNGGTTDANPSTKTAPYNGNIGSLPTPPTRTGYTFAGWNTGADGSGTVLTASTSVAANIIVYAQWTINSYTVTFDKNGGTTDANPATKTAPYGNTIGTLPTPPTKTGNTFAGWNTAADGSGTAFTASTSVSANITVYAQWSNNAYTVTFDKNGGTADPNPTTKTAAYGGNVGTLPTPPTKAGNAFAGWNTAADGSGTVFTASTSVTANITVYAQWAINSYSVTFDKNGGTTDANPSTKTAPYNGNIGTLPTPPTRTGYTFAGWNTAADGSGTAFTATTGVAATVTVYAQWTINTFTVTFDKNGGTTGANPGTDTVTYGGSVGSLPTPPSKTGYTFAGWNTAADGSGTAFTATTSITATITVYAQWTINTYTVTFDKNGGATDATPTSKTATYAGNIGTLPTPPSKTGYTFAGWNTTVDGSGSAFIASTSVTANVTVYAQWTINTCTVTFDKNGGTADANPITKSAPYGNNVGTLPTPPTKTGYTFAGWNTAADGSGTAFTAATNVTASVTVYAQWSTNSYTVTFDKNGGTIDANPTTKSAAFGGNVGTLPTPPTKTGSAFAGWNTAADGSGTAFTATTSVTASITAYAQWAINSYSVTFDKNGGTTDANPSTKTAPYNGNIGTLPTPPTRTGYTFAGWNTAADGSGTAFTATTSVAATITVYAQWTINTFTVTFDKNGGTTGANPGTETAPYGGNVGTLPTPPAKTGYTFAGWNTATDGSGTAFTATTSITAILTVYAQWTINTYTVTFDKNGGSTDANPTSKTATYGGNIGSLPAAATKAGYTFTGWNTATDGSGTAFTATTSVTATITVYAQWTINTYTVTFDKNGGTTDASPTTKTAPYGNSLGTLPTPPTRTGYTFASWNTAGDGTGAAFTASTSVTANTTVYALWTTNSYTVTFDKNGGTTDASPTTKSAAYNGNVGTLPTPPTKTGSAFAGWNTAANGSGTAFTATTSITASIIVYAQWAVNSYSVTFDKNGGTTDASPTTKTALYGGNIGTLPAAPTRTGWTFAGWNTLSGGTGTVFTASTSVTADIIVYAQWTINSYTVTFDKNGGTTDASPTTKTASYGGNIGTLPAAPTRTGYNFAGWNTLSGGTGTAFTASTSVTTNIIVYAQWTAITYTVTFSVSGGNGSISGSLSQQVTYGGNCSAVTATPNSGYKFSGWSGGYGTANPLTVTNVTGNLNITASFAAIGCNWSVAEDFSINSDRVWSLAANGNSVVAGGQKLCWWSTDNGATWGTNYCSGYSDAVGVFGTTVLASGGTTGMSPDTWEWPSNDVASQTTLGFRAYCFAASGNYLFAGADGVYRSNDGGVSWVMYPQGVNVTANALAIIGNIIYAACSDGIYQNILNGTGYTNYWNKISGSPTGITTLAVCNGMIFAGSSAGVYKSTDGSSWTPAITGLPNSGAVNKLAATATMIFAATGSGIYLSTDNGANWFAVNTGLLVGTYDCLTVNNSYVFTAKKGDPSGIFFKSPLP